MSFIRYAKILLDLGPLFTIIGEPLPGREYQFAGLF